MNKYEIAARAKGWTCGGDDNDVIYNTNDYGCWKEAVSWSPKEGVIYDTWEDCYKQESAMQYDIVYNEAHGEYYLYYRGDYLSAHSTLTAAEAEQEAHSRPEPNDD